MGDNTIDAFLVYTGLRSRYNKNDIINYKKAFK